MPLTDVEIQEIILEEAKKHEEGKVNTIRIRHLIRQQSPDTPEEFIYDVFHRLVIKGLLTPEALHDGLQWHRLSAYGEAFLGTPSASLFLEPKAYVEELRRSVPNIDDITLAYIQESLDAFGHDLLLSATVTLGAASERAILELVESYCAFGEDPAVKKEFEKEWSIKGKYELLKDRFKSTNLRKQLPAMLAAKQIEITDLDRHFVEFETIVDILFQIYRINRNDAGHPIGVTMDKDALRCNLAAFTRYAETIFGIKDALDKASAP